MPDPRSTQAAPPDDGHLGSSTRPEDVLSVPEADQPAKPPHLQQDIPPHRSGAGIRIALLMLLIIGVAIVNVYAAFHWMP